MKRTTASKIRNLLFALTGAILLSSSAWSQTASLVRDINPGVDETISSSPEQLLTVGGKLFFVASSQEGSDRELWVSDGSAIGTQLLGNLCTGICGSGPMALGSTGGVLIFKAGNSIAPNTATRREVWRSDGTRKGTFPLLSAASERISSDGSPAASLPGGVLLFSGCTTSFTCQLWKTDGTSEGTLPLEGVEVLGLVAAGTKAYFTTHDDTLWVSDGTSEGTQKIHDFSSPVRFLTPVGNKVFFLAGGLGEELWTSDGTEEGTRALTSFSNDFPFPGIGIKAFGDHVYFLADDVIHGTEIWRSYGTPGTTRRITDFGFHAPFDNAAIFSQMEEVGGLLLFAATDGLTPAKLWTTSGDPRSTAPLQCAAGCPVLAQVRLIQTGDRVVFAGSDIVHGRELWSTNGTKAGTKLIKDVCPGLCDGLVGEAAPFSGKVFFVAATAPSSATTELWASDGTAAGTRRFADPASGFQPVQSTPATIAALGPDLCFPGVNVYGIELWASNGNPGGTRLVSDLSRDGLGSNPQNLVALGAQLFFTACDGVHQSLWKSAGTPETTVQVIADPPACASSEGAPGSLVAAGPWLFYLREQEEHLTLWRTDGTASGILELADLQSLDTRLLAFGDRIVFAQPNPGNSSSWALWQSDGTLAGTKKVFDFSPDMGIPEFLTVVGSELYFVGRQEDSSRHLWRSDGTLAGTRRLTESLDFEVPPHVTRVGSNVFFVAGTAFNSALWKTDGTSAGTVLVRGDFLGFSPTLSDLTAFHGALYFIFEDLVSHTESRSLWRSDGTGAGTVSIKTFFGEDPFDMPPSDLTVFNDRLYLAADDGIHGMELWTSNGTPEGTTLLRDIRQGPQSSLPTGLTVAGGRLFFSASDFDHGFEPWQSDGTGAGTRLVQDLAPYGASSVPQFFTAAGGRLYFVADDLLHGREVWALPLAGSGCQPTSTSLCLNGGRFKVEAQWRDFQGNTGAGQAVALTADTGYFWFFGPNNVEVILKVLDGRTLNDHFWVFFGALSNVEYTLTVTDTTTGATRRYFNPSGIFGSLGDTRGFGPLGAFSIADPSPPAKTLLPLVAERTDAAATGVCMPSAARLCLNNGRFAVEAAWKDFSSQTGFGTAVPLTTDTGYFWFFGAANVEVVIKILDGQPVNGHFWVFYGALSNVEYTLTVTDTMTGHVRTYTNPSGRFASLGDTQAF